MPGIYVCIFLTTDWDRVRVQDRINILEKPAQG